MGWTIAFVSVAVLFVLVCGANDGAALLALALRFPRGGTVSGLLSMLLPPLALVTVPLLLGYGVAEAFTTRLAVLTGPRGQAAFLAGVVVALIVVGVLSARGLPTSLTLAVIGGISGAGLGAGLAVPWWALGSVLATGLAAPAVGLALGYLLGAGSRRVPGTGRMPALVYGTHLLAYTAQCVAYAVNDGQKMFAVVSMATGVAGPPGIPGGWLAAVAALFALGALTSLTGVGERLGRGLVLARPLHIASAETAAAAAVLGSSVLGSPVSMTQSLSAGVVGAAASEGARRVRWQGVLNLGAAWLVTLPSAALLGFAAGLAVRALPALSAPVAAP
ncbi:inorganic phosphate transporter [Nonomuraea sp. NPDC046570]|uniref:inorganic phosphate transporter n=1 Tax=Nonomuraea sp. NPDC046570 TaxID=3155255 RepID=UPI0033DACDC9